MRKYSFLTIGILLLGMMSCKSTKSEDLSYSENALAQLIGEWQWVETRTNHPDYWETAEKTNISEVLCVTANKRWSLARNDTLMKSGNIVELFAQIDTICTGGEIFTYMKLYDEIAQQEIQRCYVIAKEENDSMLCTYYQPCLPGDSRKIWKKK